MPLERDAMPERLLVLRDKRPKPPYLKLVVRARAPSERDEPREIVEVHKDGEVIGQLPVTKVNFVIQPGERPKLSLDFHGWKADLVTHD